MLWFNLDLNALSLGFLLFTADSRTQDDLTGTGTSPNGWAPEEMFRTNSEQYGVKSSYDANLPEYT